MKNLATSKNEICLIAGSGLFVYEVAIYLNNKNLLNQIILINENNLLKKKFKDKCKSFKIKDRENARKKGNYKLADNIRKDLELSGVIIEDKGDKTIWKYK